MKFYIKHKEWIGSLVYPFFLLFSFSLYGQSEQAQKLLDLKLTPGQTPVQPTSEEDLRDIYYQNLHDVFYLIFFESDSAFQVLSKFEEDRLNALESFKNESRWNDFFQAEIKLHWAFIKLKQGEEWGAFWSLRSANKSIQENLEKHPNFNLNQRTYGLVNILFGVTPENYQWIFNLFGMKGSVKEGIQLLNNSQNTETVFGLETAIILGMVYSHLLEDNVRAPGFIAQHQLSSTTLASYFQGIILQKSHKAEAARGLWLSNDLSIPFRDYLIAESYFQEGKYELAIDYYNQFLSAFTGDNYKKDAFLKIALSNKFLGKIEAYGQYVSKAKESQSNSSEVDQNAQKLIDEIETLNFKMLQLRYAIDGGYYERAEQLLSALLDEGLNDSEQVELLYRQARMAHLQKNYELAIEYYEQVVESDRLIEGSYYVPNAYLQLGYLQQSLGNMEEAKSHFEQVLAFKKHPYKSSLDNKAKVALSLLNSEGE